MVTDAAKQIEKFKEFLENSYEKQIAKAVSKGEKFLLVNFTDLMAADPELAEDLLEEPEETQKAMSVALERFETPANFKIRFSNLPESQKVDVRNIRSEHIGKFMVIEGIIRQASDVRPQMISTRFECPSCGNTITIPQLGEQFREPTRCSCGRKGKFRLLSKELIDAQRIIIEECPDLLKGGAQPKRLHVYLKEDLVDPKFENRTTPGARVLVTGVVNEVQLIMKTGAVSTKFDLVMNANYVETVDEEFSDIEINKEDEEEIKLLAKDPKMYQKLINSIAPSILGEEKIKEALLLQLFGGIRKQKEDGTMARGDMHILLVGDPGCGKSAMLTFIAKAAPKARYAAGKGVSSAGLTASVVKDDFLRGWALEAGAMVLANKGIFVLDEMDKISIEDTSALHESMEQQTCTIMKANIHATLKAETSVLAAANPKLGRFDPYGPPIAKQIDLPPALINRFDLIFVLKDIPERTKDKKIARHVLGIHKTTKNPTQVLPPELIRKYIAYSKQYVQPKLTDEAIDEIEEFYVSLRNSGSTQEGAIKPIPISPRQIEALIRLSEAAAKVRLSNKIEVEDARKAIDLITFSMKEVGVDPETGAFDIDRIATGFSMSAKSKIQTVRDVIFDASSSGKKAIAIGELLKIAAEKGIKEQEVEEAIDKLKRGGDVYEPKKGFLQKI